MKYQDFSFYWKIISSSHAVKILFLSFTCEDIGVAMVTNMISQLQESFPLRRAAGSFEISFTKSCLLCRNFISIYKISKTLPGRLGIRILSSRSEGKIRIPARPRNILYRENRRWCHRAVISITPSFPFLSSYSTTGKVPALVEYSHLSGSYPQHAQKPYARSFSLSPFLVHQ